MLTLLVAMATLVGCATAPLPAPPPVLLGPVVLFGEVHDNPTGHTVRLQALAALVATGARPALVLEMFDRGDQPAIDAARLRHRRGQALINAVLAARPADVPKTGWDWPLYAPVLDLALRHGLPIVAGNVGRAEARTIIRDGLAAHGFDPAVPEDIAAGQARAIEAGHCGQIGADLARRMAAAQVARDQQMARAVQAHAGRGVVLLAGNGHVRGDLGVPRWLDPSVRARTEVIGVLEPGDVPAGYDRVVQVPAAPREDPCLRLRRPAR